MGTVRVVTGFVEIPGHPRSVEEYTKLGDRLEELAKTFDQRMLLFYGDVSEMWLFEYLRDTGMKVDVAVADNPAKNSAAYHIVQHQKSHWLMRAAELDTTSDVFAWLDYGIFSVPGVTEEAIQHALERAAYEKAICIPGCWPHPTVNNDDQPNWRFCGGFWVVPRAHVFELDVAMKAECLRHLRRTKKLTWEVNTLACVEATENLPIWWYEADHNASMFLNYPVSPSTGN